MASGVGTLQVAGGNQRSADGAERKAPNKSGTKPIVSRIQDPGCVRKIDSPGATVSYPPPNGIGSFALLSVQLQLEMSTAPADRFVNSKNSRYRLAPLP